jgi:hypothetical protein
MIPINNAGATLPDQSLNVGSPLMDQQLLVTNQGWTWGLMSPAPIILIVLILAAISYWYFFVRGK